LVVVINSVLLSIVLLPFIRTFCTKIYKVGSFYNSMWNSILSDGEALHLLN
jgi:hypothetical protein